MGFTQEEKQALFDNAKQELIMNIENLENNGESLRLIQQIRAIMKDHGVDFIYYSPYIRNF